MGQNYRYHHLAQKFVSSSCTEIEANDATPDVALKFRRNPPVMLDIMTVTCIFPVWATTKSRALYIVKDILAGRWSLLFAANWATSEQKILSVLVKYFHATPDMQRSGIFQMFMIYLFKKLSSTSTGNLRFRYLIS